MINLTPHNGGKMKGWPRKTSIMCHFVLDSEKHVFTVTAHVTIVIQ